MMTAPLSQAGEVFVAYIELFLAPMLLPLAAVSLTILTLSAGVSSTPL